AQTTDFRNEAAAPDFIDETCIGKRYACGHGSFAESANGANARDRALPSARRHNQSRRNSKLAFTPPKPKPLESAYSVDIFRADPLTMSIPSDAESDRVKLSVGGASWSRSASTVKIASTPPAAPNKCPVDDLVADTAGPRSIPNTALIAASSLMSPTGVDVA